MVNSLNLLFILLVCSSIALVNCTHNETSQSPMPLLEKDCSTVIYNLEECTSFLVDDMLKTTPDKSCCYRLKTMLEAGTECLCDALTSIIGLGLDLDMKMAMSLPSACGITLSPRNKCNAPTDLAEGSASLAISDSSLASIFGDSRSRAHTISTSFPLLFGIFFLLYSLYNLT